MLGKIVAGAAARRWPAHVAAGVVQALALRGSQRWCARTLWSGVRVQSQCGRQRPRQWWRECRPGSPAHWQRTIAVCPPVRLHGTSVDMTTAAKVQVVFRDKDGEDTTVTGREGMTLLEVAHMFEIPMEGACEGVCACSTCHVILEDEVFDGLPEAEEEEDDMLDQAFGLTSTSRLGCQVHLRKEHAGMVVQLPAATRNFYVDGHVPQPH